MNGNDVLREYSNQWEVMRNKLTLPYQIVLMRMKESLCENKGKFDKSDINGLKDEISLIQSRLSEKLQEGRHVSSELSAVQQEKEKMFAENTRLNHRIEYLEDQVNNLENGMKQVTSYFLIIPIILYRVTLDLPNNDTLSYFRSATHWLKL